MKLFSRRIRTEKLLTDIKLILYEINDSISSIESEKDKLNWLLLEQDAKIKKLKEEKKELIKELNEEKNNRANDNSTDISIDNKANTNKRKKV